MEKKEKNGSGVGLSYPRCGNLRKEYTTIVCLTPLHDGIIFREEGMETHNTLSQFHLLDR